MKIVSKNSVLHKKKTIKKIKINFIYYFPPFSTRAYSIYPKQKTKAHNLSDLGRVKPEAKFIS
jgi:hypothetical protein